MGSFTVVGALLERTFAREVVCVYQLQGCQGVTQGRPVGICPRCLHESQGGVAPRPGRARRDA